MRNVLLSWRYSLTKGNFYDSHHDSLLYSGKNSIIFQVLSFLLFFMLGYIQLNSLEAKTFSFVVQKPLSYLSTQLKIAPLPRILLLSSGAKG